MTKKPSSGDVLRTIGFTRTLQKMLLGEVFETPQSVKMEKALELKGISISRETWNKMWNGKHFPGPQVITKFCEGLPEISSRWLELNPLKSRVDMFFDCLNIYSQGDQRRAYQMLKNIFLDWMPGYTGTMSILGPKERVAILKSKIHGQSYSKTLYNQAFNGVKEKRSELKVSAQYESQSILNLMDLSSLLPFMLRYAFDSRLPDDGLIEDFSLDLISATLCTIVLAYEISNGLMRPIGHTGGITEGIRMLFGEASAKENHGFTIPVYPFEHLSYFFETYYKDSDVYEHASFIEEIRNSFHHQLQVMNIPSWAIQEQFNM